MTTSTLEQAARALIDAFQKYAWDSNARQLLLTHLELFGTVLSTPQPLDAMQALRASQREFEVFTGMRAPEGSDGTPGSYAAWEIWEASRMRNAAPSGLVVTVDSGAGDVNSALGGAACPLQGPLLEEVKALTGALIAIQQLADSHSEVQGIANRALSKAALLSDDTQELALDQIDAALVSAGDVKVIADFGRFLRMDGEANQLAPILSGMVEGGSLPENRQDMYKPEFSPPDGDVYVLRAAELLREQQQEIFRLTDELARTTPVSQPTTTPTNK